MKKVIKITDTVAFIDGKEIQLEDIIIHHNGCMMRADYIVQIIRKHNFMPNKFSIAKKLDKYVK